MSLVGTLGRMAVGVMVAKGVGKMMSNRQSSGRTAGTPSGGLGGMLGGLLGGQGGAMGGGMGGLSGGAAGSRTGGMSGGLGGGSGGGPAGGLGSLLGGGSGGLGSLGSMLGGRSGAAGAGAAGGLAGGLGGLLEKISGGDTSTRAAGSAPTGGSFGDLLNSSLAGESGDRPDAGQEEHAKLLIRAMVNAAKSDGHIDEDEQRRIVEHIGDEATAEDREFVLAEMRAPLDVDGFVKSVPRGAEREVYMMSLMGIDLDEEAEARYLDTLREGMGLSESDAEAIHEQLGVPSLRS